MSDAQQSSFPRGSGQTCVAANQNVDVAQGWIPYKKPSQSQATKQRFHAKTNSSLPVGSKVVEGIANASKEENASKENNAAKQTMVTGIPCAIGRPSCLGMAVQVTKQEKSFKSRSTLRAIRGKGHVSIGLPLEYSHDLKRHWTTMQLNMKEKDHEAHPVNPADKSEASVFEEIVEHVVQISDEFKGSSSDSDSAVLRGQHTRTPSIAPKKKLHRRSHSFHGISFVASTKKFMSFMWARDDDGHRKQVYLGTYVNKYQAALIRDVAVILLGHYECAKFNFDVSTYRHLLDNQKALKLYRAFTNVLSAEAIKKLRKFLLRAVEECEAEKQEERETLVRKASAYVEEWSRTALNIHKLYDGLVYSEDYSRSLV